MKIKPILIFFLGTLGVCSQSHSGYPVTDETLIATVQGQKATLSANLTTINGSIITMNTNLAQLLTRIGTATVQGSDKIVSTISSDGDSTRKFMVSQLKSERSYKAQKALEVSENICADSASSAIYQASNKSSSIKNISRSGVNNQIKNEAVASRYNSPAPIAEIDSAVSAKIHSNYCDINDFKAYGNSNACKEVSSTMPGADKRIDTVLSGAGINGKKTDLTFTPDQTDASYAYVQNALKRSISPELRKGEADTVAGSQYIGYMTEYNSVVSAASDPIEQLIADSQPDDDATEALRQSISDSSALNYWKNTASLSANKLGKISLRELEQFDVNRRYANPEYNGDLYRMSGDNLTRELIKVQIQSNYLQLQIKNQLVKNNILIGLSLSSQARAEYTPILTNQYRKVINSLGGAK